ncbi:tRNA (adenine(22)-N(1))-methyltransferase [Paenibacillus flagellatus]|uniref:tRNA (Adenine-N(1))-methyltransferase n=1 Tax=Paenibacillus flagellatus TaxID=2211139 RepID=A0A2V5KLQ5_9BACL|nr:class I SAM-dependent methyltransferase [Paenibacillus flagellatus]PYI51747.1 tRNA (adenine-N(1))-methyltransferase [Paenibacillus flagellatus]
MVKLSKRLQTIAGYVPEGARLADIGSDHALLPVYLAERGRVSFAVAGEINAGPLAAADKQVKLAGLGSVVSVRQGDGLAVIGPGEADVVTIAGMGGSLIATILEEGSAKLAGVRKLVLQPNVAEDQVRRWLTAHDWVLEDETIVEEDGKYYEVLSAVRHPEPLHANAELYRPRPLEGCGMLESDELVRFGPYLTLRPNDVFFRKWASEADKLDRIAEGMARGGTEAAAQRRKEFEAERDRIKEVMRCLQKAKPSSSS